MITVSNDGVRIAIEGGIDNSTSTKEWSRTTRAGITAATTISLAAAAASAYASEQAASSASNVAASRAAAATAASKNAQAVRLAEIEAAGRALPAAGSVIPAHFRYRRTRAAMKLEIMIVVLGSLLWIWALAGCAGPEPYRPMTATASSILDNEDGGEGG